MTPTTPLPTRRFVALLAGGALALTACGSGASAETSAADGLATLETDSAATSDPSITSEGVDSVAGDLAADEAALALSECLRAEGLDVPDIGVDADGNIDLRGAFEDLGPGDDSFRTAMDACSSVLEGVEFGGGGRGAGLAENTELQDAFLEFSDCIRAEGFEDVADLTFGAPGAGQVGGATPPTGTGDGEGPGRGQREGGFGDRNDQFAGRLGLDPEDPEVIAALEVCSPIIDQAFSGAGIGQPGEGA
ncbi:MAG: hypothetical protein R8G01_18715 [Ilumatobacteraceae bacterium]|nr:hypothetical protein [Ilumatobacteraceae bacterium]